MYDVTESVCCCSIACLVLKVDVVVDVAVVIFVDVVDFVVVVDVVFAAAGRWLLFFRFCLHSSGSIMR